MTPEHTEGPWQAKNEHEPYTIIGGIDGPDEGRMHYTEICTVNGILYLLDPVCGEG